MSTTKGETTEQLLVETALRLFQERGFDKTTMRLIASEAGVSVGNAYYYFASKEHLVQAFYERAQVEHGDAAEPLFARETDFENRLHGLLRARIATMQPYREFASSFFRSAADPTSALSPFSAESEPARVMAIALYERALTGSTIKVNPSLGEQLPFLLWLYQMAVVLYWVHDTSKNSAKTYLLIDKTVPMVVRLVRMSRLKPIRGMFDDALSLLASLRTGS